MKLFMSIAALLACALVLVLFPPERYGFYPRCPFFEATGLLCPGCGGTRALAALMRGDLIAAWHLNALLVTLLLSAAGWGLVKLWLKDATVSRGVWIGVGLVVSVFGVWRNI